MIANPLGGLTLLVAVVLSGPQSQHARFDHLTPADGLCNSSPTCFLQDRDGYLWIATQDGVNRFDGATLVTFQHDPDDETTLQGSWVDRIIEAPSGDLWMNVSVGGVARLSRSTGELTRFQASEGPAGSLSSNIVLSLAFSKTGDVWLGTRSGLDWLPPGGDRWVHPTVDSENGEAPPSAFTTLFLDSRDRLWCGGPDGILHLDREDDRLVPVELEGRSPSIAAIFEDDDLSLWALTQTGLFLRLDEEGRRFEVVANGRRKVRSIGLGCTADVLRDSRGRIWCPIQGGRPLRFDPREGRIEDPLARAQGARDLEVGSVSVTRILEDRDGDLWFGSASRGLYRYRETPEPSILRYRHRPTDPGSILGDEILSLFEDRAGLLWVGVRGRGVSRLDHRKQEFLHVKHDPGLPDSLPPSPISSLAAARSGTVWVGTKGSGLYRLDPATGDVRSARELDPDGRRHRNVTALLADGNDTLWIGTLDSGITRVASDGEAGPAHLRSGDSPGSLASQRVVCLADSRDGIWVGHGTDGLGRIDDVTLHSTPYALPHGAGDSPPDVLAILEEDERTVWIGLYGGGLLRLDPVTGEVVAHELTANDTSPAGDRTVTSLLLARTGDLWVGTYSAGLHRLDRNAGRTHHLTHRHGLPSNMINGMVEDSRGDVWLATNRGLSRLAAETGRLRNFTRATGPQNFEYSVGAATVGPDGIILVGGENGVDVFHPGNLREEISTPPVVLTSFKKYDEELLHWGADRTAPFELSHRDNFLSFEFAVLDYSNPEGHRYRYRLEPIDRGWIDARDRRFVSYTDLSPGEYVFRVAGAVEGGAWNLEGASLSFVIVPPFWKTPWFRISSVLTVFGLGLLAYWIRVRRIKLQNRALEATVAEKTAELQHKNEELRTVSEDKSELIRIVSHDIRTPLTSIGAYLDLTIDSLKEDERDLGDAIEDLEQAQGAARRVSRLLGGMLNAAAIEDGKLHLNLEPVDLDELLEERGRFHRRVAEQKEIELSYNGNEVLPEVVLDPDRIGEVLDNLLSNAIKYTHPGGRVELDAKTADGSLVVRVTDTGQGMSEEDLEHVFQRFRRLSARPTGGESSTGLGLAIVKKIVELHGGRVGVESRQGEGSTFFFHLPVNEPRPTVSG